MAGKKRQGESGRGLAVVLADPSLRHLWWYGVAVLVFVLACVFFSAGRGLHIDEVATLREGRMRTVRPGMQSQHAWFLDAYWWYFERARSLLTLRVPSIVATGLGLWLSAVMAGVIAGGGWKHQRRAAGWGALAVLLMLPRVWVSALEIRFYGFMLLFGAMALAGVLAAWCGRLVIGYLLALGSGIVSYKFHVAGAPAHGVFFAAVLAAHVYTAWQRLLILRRDPGVRTGKDAVVIGSAALVVMGMLAAAVLLVPQAADLADRLSRRTGNKESERLADGWTLAMIAEHVCSWAPRGWAGWTAAMASVVLAGLALGGIAALMSRRLYAAAALLGGVLFVHYAVAFTASWNVLFAIKYLSSTLPVLGILAGTAIAFLCTLSEKRWWMLVAVLLAAGGAPAVYDITLVLGRDPSNVVPIGRRIEAEAGTDTNPNVFAPLAFIAMNDSHLDLGLGRPINGYAREVLGVETEKALVSRDAPFYKIELLRYGVGDIGGLPREQAFRRRGPYYSSFNSDFHYYLWHLEAAPVVLPGMAAKLRAGKKIAFPEAGSWRVEISQGSTVAIGETVYTNGDLFETKGAAVYTWSGAGARLAPAYDAGPARRSGAYAQYGNLYEYNTPKASGTANGFVLSSNVGVGYRFTFPSDAAYLSVYTRQDAPVGGGFFAVLFNGRPSGVYYLPPNGAEGGAVRLNIPVPETMLGRRGRVDVVNLDENGGPREDSPEVKVFFLDSIETGIPDEEMEYSPLLTSVYTPMAIPALAEDQVIAFNRPGSAKRFKPYSATMPMKAPFIMEDSSDGVVVRIPDDTDCEGVLLEAYDVNPGETIALEVEASTANLEFSSIALLAAFFDSSGKPTVLRDLSKLTLGRERDNPARRGGLLVAPEDAAKVMLYFYHNRPPAHVLESNRQFTVHSIKFLSAPQ